MIALFVGLSMAALNFALYFDGGHHWYSLVAGGVCIGIGITGFLVTRLIP